MFIVAVSVFVKPEFVQQFIDASLANAAGSRREPDNVRWDFCQAENDPTQFLLYEAYTSKDAFAVHQQQPHYLAWRDAVADMMDRPRAAVKLRALFFGDGEAG